MELVKQVLIFIIQQFNGPQKSQSFLIVKNITYI